MGAGAEVIHQSIPVLDVQYRCIAKEIEEIVDVSAAAAVAVAAAPSSPVFRQADRGPEPAAAAVDVTVSELDLRASDAISNVPVELLQFVPSIRSGSFADIGSRRGMEDEHLPIDLRASDAISNVPVEPLQFVPSIRSGSFANIGPRRDMEDEHIRIDDLSTHLGSLICPTPSAFYGVFDGHGGPDAAAYIKRHAMTFLFEDAKFPQASEADKDFVESVENSVREAFLHADHALAEDCTISRFCGTTALTALVFGRHLLVANAGDCRAVLCRKGEAVDMSQDHRPIHAAERQRVEQSGGYVDDGYLNGYLSVTRALGDWHLKMPRGFPSPLIAEPEFRQAILTEDDEFLIIGCDGIWDVMSSQYAVSTVRRGLRRHDDPERCARELVMEALRLNTSDNVTVIVICFLDEYRASAALHPQEQQQLLPRLRCCKSLSAEALCNLRSCMDNDGNN